MRTNQERANVRGHEHVEDVVEAVDGAGEEGADGGADGPGSVDDGGHGGQRLRGPAQTGMRAQLGGDGRRDEGVGPVHQESDGEEEAHVAGVALARSLVQLTGSAVTLVRQKL